MGLVKTALSSALGADKVKTGFNGPQLPFVNNHKNMYAQQRARSGIAYEQGMSATEDQRQYHANEEAWPQQSMSSAFRQDMQGDQQRTWMYGSDDVYGRSSRSSPSENDDYGRYRSTRDAKSHHADAFLHEQQSYPAQPPRCEKHDFDDGARRPTTARPAMASPYETSNAGTRTPSRRSPPRPPPRSFRPLALPQVACGDGQPFLRAYSHELACWGITEEMMISALDKINIAVIPNPEVQLFQKGASIAGWFVPGSAGLGLMAGQIAVGIGSAFGHASLLSRALAKLNLETFLPRGLEICIGKSKDVDSEVGCQASEDTDATTSTEDRIRGYGELIAPLTVVLPQLQNVGRSDPIAALGRGLGQRTDKKKFEKAQKDLSKGKAKKMQALTAGISWLMVREASSDTLTHWRRILQESDVALRQEQGSAGMQQDSRAGY